MLCFHGRNIFKYRSVRAKKTVDLEFNIGATKGGFFQKVRFVFQISKSPKKIFQKTILNLKFRFPANNTLLLLPG